MKILIVSATHRQHRNLEKAIEKERPFDMLIHLGDVEGGDDYIAALAECPTYFVRGNNDFFSDLPAEDELMVEGYHIFITHGHAYYVSMGEERLIQEAKERDADIVMYGHTHRPSCRKDENLLILNPGSMSYPRQEGRRPSYMLMHIDDQGRVEVSQEYL